MSLRPNDLIIHDGNARLYIDVENCATGLIPRNYETHPQGCYASAPPAEIALIPKSEWSARIKEMVDTKSRLSDLRLIANNGQPIPSLDQNDDRWPMRDPHWGYCWAHSSTHAVTTVRMIMGLPYVPLSAFAVAATIKNGRNEGGWGAQSLDFITERGVPSQEFWPQKEASLKYGTPECWANAALHKVTEGWIDLATPQYDRTLTFDQMMTLLLSRTPVVTDFNWWGHSVMALDPVEIEPGSFGIRIWNSWSDTWGDKGMGVLQGKKAIPDGAVAPRVITAADK